MIKKVFALGLASLLALAVIPTDADAVLIGFNPLSNPNGTAYTGHVENGFTVSTLSGYWWEAHVFGNPVPAIWQTEGNTPTSYGPASGQLSVTQGGAAFKFRSVDFGDAGGTDNNLSVNIEGWLNGGMVFSHLGLGSGPGSGLWSTALNPSSGTLIDDLRIQLIDPTGTDSNIDNISIDAVPEPGTLLLLGAGLLGGGMRLRRRRKA